MFLVKNKKAEELEKKGLWRRAATHWLTTMQQCHTSEEQDWVRRRRNYCLSKITKRKHSNLDIRELNQAASLVLQQMGSRVF
ncbi:hypothetical protein YA29_16340 [Klebsiella aerogenes]|uniref:ANR family transcriptional regulator n=1 Tax=Klebsiella aerogenes TaxID=548 RepID=UPI00063CE425|nr:ANR family transcriptional regulator [Klebsiella aerogenes]KLF28695.1 hypothetical protein YA29_16340 [Klebsiella aerogenes]